MISHRVGILAFVLGSIASAQTFEAASVRVVSPEPGQRMFAMVRGGPGTTDPTRVTYNNFQLSSLITIAFDVKQFQISGLDAADRYNVVATMPVGTTKAQAQIMLRNLLVEIGRAHV